MFEDMDPEDLKKVLNKPSYFVEEFIGVEPIDYQREFLDSGAKRRVFVAGRQVGKSRSSAWLALWYAVTHTDETVLILAKAKRQAMELFKTVKGEMRGAEEMDESEWGIPRETRTVVQFDNGSRIVCLPVGRDGSNIRGYSADLLMVDEAAFIRDEIFQEVLSPFLAVGENMFVMTSTPLGKKGYFYERFREAMNGENNYHVTHAETRDNPYVGQEFLDEMERSLTPMQYKQEIEGKFVESADAYFTTDEVLDNDVAVGEPVKKETQECYLGCDVAHTGDDASVYVSMDGKGNVFDIEHTNGKKLTDAMGRIKELDHYHDYDKIMIDATGLGTGVVDQLEETIGRKVEGFKFTNPKKADLYSTLKDAFQNKDIRFRHERQAGRPENKLVNQLTALEYEYTSTGRLKISHPSGGHDDFCDALALAHWSRHERPFTPSDKESMQPFNLGSLRSEE